MLKISSRIHYYIERFTVRNLKKEKIKRLETLNGFSERETHTEAEVGL